MGVGWVVGEQRAWFWKLLQICHVHWGNIAKWCGQVHGKTPFSAGVARSDKHAHSSTHLDKYSCPFRWVCVNTHPLNFVLFFLIHPHTMTQLCACSSTQPQPPLNLNPFHLTRGTLATIIHLFCLSSRRNRWKSVAWSPCCGGSSQPFWLLFVVHPDTSWCSQSSGLSIVLELVHTIINAVYWRMFVKVNWARFEIWATCRSWKGIRSSFDVPVQKIKRVPVEEIFASAEKNTSTSTAVPKNKAAAKIPPISDGLLKAARSQVTIQQKNTFLPDEGNIVLWGSGIDLPHLLQNSDNQAPCRFQFQFL